MIMRRPHSPKDGSWHRWFAWYPVPILRHSYGPDCDVYAWLTWIERRWEVEMPYVVRGWEYRA